MQKISAVSKLATFAALAHLFTDVLQNALAALLSVLIHIDCMAPYLALTCSVCILKHQLK